MRVFGIPEDTPGSVDANVLSLNNNQLKVSSPLDLEDLEGVHRIGGPHKKDDMESAVAAEAPVPLPTPLVQCKSNFPEDEHKPVLTRVVLRCRLPICPASIGDT